MEPPFGSGVLLNGASISQRPPLRLEWTAHFVPTPLHLKWSSHFDPGHHRFNSISYHTENILGLCHGYTTVGSWFFFNNVVHLVTVIYVKRFLERNSKYNVTEKCYVG